MPSLDQRPLIERLEAASIPEPNSGCWLWFGAPTAAGYGLLSVNNQRRYTHVIAYELAKGPVPPTLVVDHLCRNPCCINPDHLEAVTQRENIARGLSAKTTKARFAAMTHFKCGHAMTPDNTYIVGKRKERRCRTCNKADALKRWRDKRDG
jgi:hypothetical protein